MMEKIIEIVADILTFVGIIMLVAGIFIIVIKGIAARKYKDPTDEDF